jgi:hypothetical protein
VSSSGPARHSVDDVPAPVTQFEAISAQMAVQVDVNMRRPRGDAFVCQILDHPREAQTLGMGRDRVEHGCA